MKKIVKASFWCLGMWQRELSRKPFKVTLTSLSQRILFGQMISHLCSFPLSLFEQICSWFFSEVGLGPVSNRIMKSISENYGWKLSYIYTYTHTHIYIYQFSLSVVSDSLQPHRLQHTRLPCPSSTPWACSHSCPSGQWCHPNISSSVAPFSSHLQSFPTSRSSMSQFFASGGQSIGALASVLLMNMQVWFPLQLTGLISLQSKGLSKVFSNTTVQKHQFFGIYTCQDSSIRDSSFHSIF